jgi:hypothetical protein
LWIAQETIANLVQGPASLAEMTVDLDGHIQYQGPAMDLARGNENAGIGAPFQIRYLIDAPTLGDALCGGRMWEIFGPEQRSAQTDGQATKRLDIRGLSQVESRDNSIVWSRRRYECPSALFERWADREGLSRDERRAIMIGGKPAKTSRLRRTEAISVPQSVSSRKDRTE